jgi:hypothetical protein
VALSAVGGALLTLVALAALAAGGYLLALRLLGRERAAADPLGLAIATGLAATAQGVGVALAAGACGELRLGVALGGQLALCAALLVWPPPGGTRRDLAAPLRLLAARTRAQLRRHGALALLTLHAAGSEALRGLIRPPLSWDSLMYHLQLTATWLLRHDLAPVFGAYPMTYDGYVPANGAVWVWWWMAPSHGELYCNLAFLPQWALLGLAAGGVARRLGARRHWPLAAFLVLLTPTVLRFAATQYVDIFTAACLVAGCYFGLSWMRQPRWSDALLAAAGLGLAAGTKVLGLAYAAALAATLLPLAVGAWRRRTLQAAAALLVAGALGGFFYLRNVALGAGPLALQCEGLPHREPVHGAAPRLPRPNSVAALPGAMLGEGRLARAFLGTIEEPGGPVFADLGLGPQALVVLLGLPALAVLARGRRREGLVVGVQIVAEAAVWATVPYAASNHVFANVRYLVPAIALALAAGVAGAESFRPDAVPGRKRWLTGIALAIAAQDLLLLHTQLSDGPRLAIAAADLAAVALALAPGLRRWAAASWPALAGAALAAALLAAPAFARFRAADRTRAFDHEFTAHVINVGYYASGWDWLDRHDARGVVDVVNSPDTFFFYPAMGPFLTRQAVYVNIDARNLPLAAAYPLCQPRIDPDPAAWLANLRRADARWLDLSRTPPFPFPLEDAWARRRPDRFALRFADDRNRIYELLPDAAPTLPAAPPPQAPGGGAAR